MDKAGRIFGVINGMADQGKSYLIKKYMLPKLVKERPVLALDVIGEYPGEQYQDFEEFFQYVKKTGGIEKKIHAIKWTTQETAINLIRFVREMEVPVCLILEEAHILFNNSDIKKGIKKALPEICFLGAHFGFTVFLCTQRPKSLPTDVRSQCDFIVSFKQTEAADLEYLRKKGGAPEDAKEIIANLNQKQFFTIGEQPKGFNELKTNKVNQL